MNMLKHSFNAAACIAGAAVSSVCAVVTASEFINRHIGLPQISNGKLVAAFAVGVAGSTLFSAAYQRFTSKPVTADTDGPVKYIKDVAHVASAYAGATALGLGNFLMAAAPIMVSGGRGLSGAPLSPEYKMAWWGMNAVALALFTAGYGRVLSKKAEPSPSLQSPNGPA